MRLPNLLKYSGIVLFAVLLALCAVSCKKTASSSPPTPAANLTVVSGSADPAKWAAIAITQQVTAAARDGQQVRFATLPRLNLSTKAAADTYQPVTLGRGEVLDLTGYTCFTGHDAADPTAPTTIYLLDTLSRADAYRWGVHEWGHVVFWRVSDETSRREWLAIWEDARDRNALPSAYAGTSQFEGFAETMAFYCRGELKDAKLKAFLDAMVVRLNSQSM